MYVEGKGASQDYGEAVRWFKKAAIQGFAEAQTNLGVRYVNGEGVPQDYVQAHMWLNLAAASFPPGANRDATVKARDSIAARLDARQNCGGPAHGAGAAGTSPNGRPAMRTIVTICLWLVLAGCSDMPVAPGSLEDRLGIGSTEKYKANIEARKAADDAKCREFGFKPKTEAYGNCRLQLEQIRATERASRNRQAAPSTRGGGQGMSFMCKDAISRGDRGGTFTFC